MARELGQGGLMLPAVAGGPPSLQPSAGDAWTQRVGPFTLVPALIRQFGVDPAPILASCGFAADALDRPDDRISYRGIARLLSEAAARTGCPHFGLLAGRAWQLGDLGVLGDLMRHSPTVGDALHDLVVHQHVNSEGGVAFVVHRGAVVDFGYAIYAPGVVGSHHLYDAVMALVVRTMATIGGSDWAPSEFFFPHAPPVDAKPFRQYFRAPLRFNAEFCAVRFPASSLARRIEGAEPDRYRRALAQVLAAGPAGIVQRVYRALRTLLLHGKGSGGDVARSLAMHRRTLNRRLSGEGVTFQQVLDDVRFTVARELLDSSEVTMTDIAAALGYSGLAPFMRAFRRWSGTTPGAWRQSPR